MTLPLAGHPVGTKKEEAKNELDLINSAYRFLIADLFPFGRRAVIGLEHGGKNDSTEHYAGVVYWYGIDSPALTMTDQFHTCSAKDIESHQYNSPDASDPYELVSRYEWGSDHAGPIMHFPAQADMTRTTQRTSEFNVELNPKNLGVLLRRKFDYSYPNQRADIWVKPADRDGDWQYVGQWYTAGSNTCIHSYPRKQGELGKTQPRIVTSNRRWREEEFLIPRHLTENVQRLAIRVKHIPDNRPLYPEHPFPIGSAWSEARYYVYCYQMPEIQLTKRHASGQCK